MSFLRTYMSYAAANEAPEMFHVWCGFSALSATIGRRVWLAHGSKFIYPNINVLLIGDAGSGKNYAIEYPTKLMENILPPGMVSYDVETPEGLLQHLAGDSTQKIRKPSECCVERLWPDGARRDTHQIALVACEFVDFIRTNQEAWTGLLCNIYDKNNTYAYRTKGSGTNHILGPYVTLLGGMPTDISKSLQKAEIINSGFARRTIMQYGERKWDDPHALPVWSEANIIAEQQCIAFLKNAQKLEGAMKMTLEAVELWVRWYDRHTRSVPKVALPSTKGWLSSKPTQVLKLAILCAISDRTALEILPEDLHQAINFLNEMELTLHMVFGGMGRNELAGVCVKIMEYFNQCGEALTKEKLLHRFFNMLTPGKGQSELDEMLTYLVATGQLAQGHMKTGSLKTPVWGLPALLLKLDRAERGEAEPPLDDEVPTERVMGSSDAIRQWFAQGLNPTGIGIEDQVLPRLPDGNADGESRQEETGEG